MDIDFPLHFDAVGCTATTDYDDHIRDMIEQVLFTNPGERVNRPDFGGGLLQLIFGPNSPEVAAALQFAASAALQRWLGDVVDVRSLEVESFDSTLTVDISYVVLRTGATREETFELAGAR
jgi:uncharacterized protein